MNATSYTVVLLDGKEKSNLSLAEVKELFFRRQINQDSLVSSSDAPQWSMLKRVFDLTQFVPAAGFQPAAPVFSEPAGYRPSQNPFEQQQPAPFDSPPPFGPEQPVTFNQYPAQQSSFAARPAQNPVYGYTQNNQTPALYQAGSHAAPTNYARAPHERLGLRPAAIFLLLSALVSIAQILLEKAFAGGAAVDGPDAPAPAKGRIAISLVIDCYLAFKLWRGDDSQSARWWVLLRTYLGFAIYGLGLSFYLGARGELLAGAVNFVVYTFFLLSVALVLHGKQSPTPSRVMIGVGTFAVYFLLSLGAVALASIVSFVPQLAPFEASSSQLEKYRIEGSDFYDAKTGAKVSLPPGWVQISTTNPVVTSPTAKMIGFQKQSESLTMLDVLPVPAQIDIKNIRSSELLDYLADYVSENFEELIREGNPRMGRVDAREITRMSVQVGTHPAKLLVLETSMNRQKYRSHMVITFDELSMYVLHSWCPTANYEKAKDEFYALEKSFSIPDQLKSTFTEAAENEKRGAASKSGF